ncbi:hypothetical protein [Desulfurobacterium crinifex]
MRRSDIWVAIEDLKVFQIRELVDYLHREWDFLPKSQVKKKVWTSIQSWIKDGLIVRVHKEPPIFAHSEHKSNWKEIYKNKIKFCSHCGKPFIPRSPNQKFCHRKLCDRDRQLLKKKNFKRKPRWKEEEVKLLWETFGLKGFSKEKAEELSQKLGRSVTAIKEKYRELRRATQCV